MKVDLGSQDTDENDDEDDDEEAGEEQQDDEDEDGDDQEEEVEEAGVSYSIVNSSIIVLKRLSSHKVCFIPFCVCRMMTTRKKTMYVFRWLNSQGTMFSS